MGRFPPLRPLHAARVISRKRDLGTARQALPPHAAQAFARAAPRPHGVLQRMESTSSGRLVQTCVGLLYVEFEQNRLSGGDAGVATGTLIDARHILTCAHNVVEVDSRHVTRNRAKLVRFIPGYVPEEALKNVSLSSALKVEYAFVPSSYGAGSEFPTWDIAVLRLETPYGGVQQFPQLAPPGALETKAPQNWFEIPKINMSGHGHRWNNRSLVVDEVAPTKHRISYRSDSVEGSSGSPVFIDGTIWAVHYASRGGPAFATGLFKPICAFVQQALSATPTTGFIQPL